MSIKIIQILSEEDIRNCFERKILEEKFEAHSVSVSQRMDLLLEVMGNPAIAYASDIPEEEERYEIIIDTFLSGVWRETSDI
ncbi:MAG: hypothetical protein LBC87_09090 [Fibromonadaceae bacterium]|jgi:predicted RNA-binding protein with PUA domain|nr:hypothetical protein [Fibromonadaceae bacterium]